MTPRDECLRIIGDIAVRWSKAESELREIFWLYVGTDRPTFDMLFSRANGDHVEMQLKRLVSAKEVDVQAQKDVLSAISQIKIHRKNRNIILHRLRTDHVDDAEKLLPKLQGTADDISAFLTTISTCREQLARFLAERDSLETPDGIDSAPSSDDRIPTYSPMEWPTKCQELEI